MKKANYKKDKYNFIYETVNNADVYTYKINLTKAKKAKNVSFTGLDSKSLAMTTASITYKEVNI